MNLKELFKSLEKSVHENHNALENAAEEISNNLREAANLLKKHKITNTFLVWDETTESKITIGLSWENSSFILIYDNGTQNTIPALGADRQERVFIVAKLLPLLIQKIIQTYSEGTVELKTIIDKTH